MFGGYYVIGEHNGRAIAFVFGPTKTLEELPKADPEKAVNAAGYTWPDDNYPVEWGTAFVLMPTLHLGCCNDQVWINVAKGSWGE